MSEPGSEQSCDLVRCSGDNSGRGLPSDCPECGSTGYVTRNVGPCEAECIDEDCPEGVYEVSADNLRADGGLPTEVAIRESSWDDWIVVDCPQCLEPMHLGEYWKEIILEESGDTEDIPACPDCSTEDGDQWSEDAEPMLDGIEFRVLAGDVIETRSPWSDDGHLAGGSP